MLGDQSVREHLTPDAELLRAVLAHGTVVTRIRGASMAPFVLPRAKVSVTRCAYRDLRPGDLVLFTMGSRPYVHRVVRTSNGEHVTQGDCCSRPDGGLSPDQLLGRVDRLVVGWLELPYSERVAPYVRRLLLPTLPWVRRVLRPIRARITV